MSLWDKVTGKSPEKKKNFWSNFRKGMVKGLAATAVCVGGAAVGGPVGFFAALGGIAAVGVAKEIKEKNKVYKTQKQKIAADKTKTAARKEKDLKQLKIMRRVKIMEAFGLASTGVAAAMAVTDAKVQARKQEKTSVAKQQQPTRATTREVKNVLDFVRKNTNQK